MNVNIRPENLSWKKLIDHIQLDERLKGIPRIGIIVDSDFSNIVKYNERSSPIIWNFYLPKNIQLIYATADGGTEYLANFLIKEADKVSSFILGKIKTGEIPLNSSVTQGQPYSHYREILSSSNPDVPPLKNFRFAS